MLTENDTGVGGFEPTFEGERGDIGSGSWVVEGGGRQGDVTGAGKIERLTEGGGGRRYGESCAEGLGGITEWFLDDVGGNETEIIADGTTAKEFLNGGGEIGVRS